jgi:hypothetical protein
LRPCAVTRTQNFQEKIIVLPLSYEFRADRYPPRARSKPADLRTPARQSRASTRAPTTPQEMRQTPTTEERRRPRAPHLPPLLFCLLHRRRSNCHGPRSLPFHPRAHRHLPRRARGREGRERSPLPFPSLSGSEMKACAKRSSLPVTMPSFWVWRGGLPWWTGRELVIKRTRRARPLPVVSARSCRGPRRCTAPGSSLAFWGLTAGAVGWLGLGWRGADVSCPFPRPGPFVRWARA